MLGMMQEVAGTGCVWLHIASKREVRRNSAYASQFLGVHQSCRKRDGASLTVAEQVYCKWVNTLVDKSVDGLMYKCKRVFQTIKLRPVRTFQCSMSVVRWGEPSKTRRDRTSEVDGPLDRHKPRIAQVLGAVDADWYHRVAVTAEAVEHKYDSVCHITRLRTAGCTPGPREDE